MNSLLSLYGVKIDPMSYYIPFIISTRLFSIYFQFIFGRYFPASIGLTVKRFLAARRPHPVPTPAFCQWVPPYHYVLSVGYPDTKIIKSGS